MKTKNSRNLGIMTTKKANESQATEATQVNNELNLDLGIFESSEFDGAIKSLAICQVLNDKANPGLFIKENLLNVIGWEGEAVNYEHIFNSGHKEKGVLLKSPKMHVLAVSPRFVENRETREILGTYETKEGQLIYAELNTDPKKKLATLRSFYMVYLVGEGNKTLHKVPLIITIKGVAAAKFGQALKEFQTKMESVYAQAMNKGFRPLNNQFHTLCVFNPTFVAELQPPQGEIKSFVAVVQSFASPANPAEIKNFLCMNKSDELWGILNSSKNFAKSILKAATVINEPLNALPPSNTINAIDVKAIAAGK